MTQSSCLQREQIEAYLLGDIDEEQIEAVDAHLADCPNCQAVADELESSSDELVDLVKQPRPHSEFADEEECQRLLDRGKAIPRERRAGDAASLKRLGEYAIIQHIGGNMGDVYVAVHTKMDRTVVLKVLPSALWSDKQAVARFEREMKAVGKLEHPHIARAYDAREIDGRQVMVMEYVPGPSLHELLKRSGRLPIADACEIARQAADGLAYVHRQGLVHRDVKPSNLMLTPEGQVKLLDWGLARFRTPRPDDEDLTGSDCALGTPHYMAPEQVTASHDVDVRADIYGLGCTLYHLLAGRTPFDSSKYQGRREIMTARLRDPIPPIQDSRPDVPDALASVLDRMLARKLEDRYGNAAQVAAVLSHFAAGADLRALATGRQENNIVDPPRPEPRPPVFRWAVAATILFVLLGFGGLAALNYFGNPWTKTPSGPVAESPADRAETSASNTNATADAGQTQPSSVATTSVPSGATSADSPAADATNKPSPTAPADESPHADPAETGDGMAQDQDWLGSAQNAESPFKVELDVDHPDRVYRGGDLMYVKVRSSRAGYLYLLHQSTSGKLVCLFPNRIQKENEIPADTEIVVPDPNAEFNLRVGPPYGKEVLKAIVTLVRLEPTEFGVASLTTSAATPLKPQDVKSVFVELKEKPAGWAEQQIDLVTGPKADSGESDPKPAATRGG